METIKKQTRKIGVAGGFFNQLMGNNFTTPKVGEGATLLMYSDRDAYEVTWVSEDGLTCRIRPMDCTFIGSSYGDEIYTYKSDKSAEETLLEWNDNKSCWGKVYHTVQIQKSLLSKLIKEHGYDWTKNLPNGLTYDDLFDKVYEDNYYNKIKLIKGVTKEYKYFDKVSVIFGVMEKYRDPHF